jgi:hypothetical protein
LKFSKINYLLYQKYISSVVHVVLITPTACSSRRLDGVVVEMLVDKVFSSHIIHTKTILLCIMFTNNEEKMWDPWQRTGIQLVVLTYQFTHTVKWFSAVEAYKKN